MEGSGTGRAVLTLVRVVAAADKRVTRAPSVSMLSLIPNGILDEKLDDIPEGSPEGSPFWEEEEGAAVGWRLAVSEGCSFFGSLVMPPRVPLTVCDDDDEEEEDDAPSIIVNSVPEGGEGCY